MTTTTRQLAFKAGPSDSNLPQPKYSLLALPPALVALLSNPDTASSLEIRGDTTDAAVLVTPSQTFAIRGVQNSNSLCLCSSGIDGGEGRGWFAGEDDSLAKEGTIEIATTLHETLEVLPGVARTERLEGLLRGSEYRGEDAEADRQRKGVKATLHTLSTLQSLLPASDREIIVALRTHRVVTINSHLRPLAPSYLLTILPSLLSSLASDAMDVDATPIKPKEVAKLGKKGLDKGKGKAVEPQATKEVKLVEAVADFDELLATLDAVDCAEEAAKGLLEWFGKEEVPGSGRWTLRVNEIVRETGIGLLAEGGYGPQKLDPFLSRWKTLCGSFAKLCALPLLAGTHLTNLSTPPTITYLPLSRLAPDPATRFTELFSIKPRWVDTEMIQFLDDLVGGDKKKRDAMVLKFVRKVKEADGQTIWTPRNLW